MRANPNPPSAANVLVGVTTYAGSLECRLILGKILRHLRWRNGFDIDLLVVSDGYIGGKAIRSYANFLLCRDGPSGLQQGELDSVRAMVAFAKARGYHHLIKLGGDVMMDQIRWCDAVLAELKASGKKMLSTHWFHNDSWVVGTKFFVADVAFLDEVLPTGLQGQCLEVALTQSIAQGYRLEDVVCLINSATGELNETSGRLAEWQWEHAHRLYKFRQLDAGCPLLERILNRLLVYWPLRVLGSIRREMGKLKKKFTMLSLAK